MTTSVSRQAGRPIRRAFKLVWMPSRLVEYTYYFAFSYSILSGFLGIEIRLVAAGLTVALGGLCLLRMGSLRKEILAPIALLLACSISFILVQISMHGASVLDDTIRSFILWTLGLIIMQSLYHRPGFLHRCTIVIFMLGLVAVPFLIFRGGTEEVGRAAADIQIGGGLTNSNGLAVWFGFCVVSFGISALETKRGMVVRTLYGLAAAGSLLIVGLTVSRGALLGCAIALTVGFRRLLKRSFVPVLVLVSLAGVVLVSGLVDPIISGFEERAGEETGRFLVWPVVIERFLQSPMVGVGAERVGTYVAEVGKVYQPHNSFLHFALASGIVPLALYLAFWTMAARRLFSDVGGSEYSPFRTPLLLYAFVAFMLAGVSTEPWALLALTLGASSGISRRRERVFAASSRIRWRRIAPAVQPPSKADAIDQARS